ncbi:MAG: C39 family peptidase [Acidobacteriota bacterium]|nr:C39 family peptidase [Acidobacteriota bacterium]MDH3529602.1 C39 family peptidase [Acidobacteriota bacterium]
MPDNINHNVSKTGAGQATRKQCWYASFKMLYKYHGRSTNEVKDRLKNVIDFNDAMENGLLDTDYRKCGDALNMSNWSGSHFNGERGFFDIGLSDGGHALVKILRKGPLWVSRYIKKGTYHIVVAKGYDDRGNGKIIFNNPYPGPDDAIEDKMDASLFARHITNAVGSVMRY